MIYSLPPSGYSTSPGHSTYTYNTYKKHFPDIINSSLSRSCMTIIMIDLTTGMRASSSRNRLPPRAYFLPVHHQLLSGRWSFHCASSPFETEPSSDDAGAWSKIDVPSHWQLQSYGRPHYINFNYPFPTDPPFVPSENSTGLYETEFTVPND